MTQFEKLSWHLPEDNGGKNHKNCHIPRVPTEIQTKHLLNTSSKMHYNLTLLRQSHKIQNNTWLRPTTFISNVILYGEHLSKKVHRNKKILTLVSD